jgi:hypothetical protein
VPALWLTGDVDAALAGFLAIGITVLGRLLFGRPWWRAYVLIASGVALVLILAPDSYSAFGLIFLGALSIILGAQITLLDVKSVMTWRPDSDRRRTASVGRHRAQRLEREVLT